jgi:hypothetical protein
MHIFNKDITLYRIAYYSYWKVRYLTQGLLQFPINFYFGNSCGLLQNITGEWDYRRISKGKCNVSDLNINTIHIKGANKLKTDGFLLLGKVKINNLVNILHDVNRRFEDPQFFLSSKNLASRFIISPLSIAGLRELFTSEIQAIVSAYYGQKSFRINSVRLWRNYHVPNANLNRDDLFSNTFHCDNYKLYGLRVFILMNDGVRRDTGSFRFHSKPDTKLIFRSFGYFHRFILSSRMLKKLVNETTLKYFEGNAGYVAIVNTQECLHAANIPRIGTYRDIIQFEVYPDFGDIKKTDDLFKIDEDDNIKNLKSI